MAGGIVSSESLRQLRRLLGQLQAEVRKPFDTSALADHGMTRLVPADIDLGQSHWMISRRSYELFQETIGWLSSDSRFEHLDRNTENEVWRFVCQCLAERGRDHREQFIKAQQQEPVTITHYFSIRHLAVREDFELADCRIAGLPLADAPDLSSLVDEPDASAVIVVSESGTLAMHQAARAVDRANHALRLLRVCLRPQNRLSRAQLQFSLGERLVTDYGAGFQRSPDAPYTAILRPNLIEQTCGQRAASLPTVGGNDLERHALLAVEWLSRAQLAEEPLIRLLFLFFALEALLGDKADKGKGHDLAFRRAMLSNATNNSFREPSATLYLYDKFARRPCMGVRRRRSQTGS